MPQNTPESPIQDRKVEVVKQPLAAPLAPAELSRRVDELVSTIRNNGCSTLAQRLAQNIANSEYGGRYQNVENAFPQLTAALADNRRAFNAQLDANHDQKLDGQELTAATLAAGKWLADHPGSAAKDVPLDQEFLNNFKSSIELLQGPQLAACTAPKGPNLALRALLPEPGKQR